MKNKVTDACDDKCDEDCAHKTEGCETCGELEDLNDNMLCEACQDSRNQYRADCIHDQMKEGDA